MIVTGLAVASSEWSHSPGALDLVRKPVDPAELLRKIKKHRPDW